MSGHLPSEFRFALPEAHIVFGRGARRQVAEELASAGCARAIILSTPEQSGLAGEISELLGSASAGTFSRAAMHTPSAVTREAVRWVTAAECDSVVAVGGGSSIGLGKAISHQTGLPQIAIPTTYAGSEATPILGQTVDGKKTTLRNARVQPRRVIYDPELLVSLPVALSVASGLNAMAHAVEALYARDRNPLSSTLAEEGIKVFARSLPRIVADTSDIEARSDTLYGAWLCGTVLGQASMALHHKLCHVLGGSFNLPHAETHAVILPHVVAYNAGATADLLTPITASLGGTDPAEAIWALARSLGAPKSLRELGISESDLDAAADLGTTNSYWNPRKVERDELRALLDAAWRGDMP